MGQISIICRSVCLLLTMVMIATAINLNKNSVHSDIQEMIQDTPVPKLKYISAERDNKLTNELRLSNNLMPQKLVTLHSKEFPDLSPIQSQLYLRLGLKGSRYRRGSPLRQPLPSTDASHANMVQEENCPADICHCQLDTSTNRHTINCRHQTLQEIPKFTLFNIEYYELTFSAGNYISKLPRLAFKNLKVERIDLLGNELNSIESGAFQGLDNYLQELLIEGNGIIPLPLDKISNLAKLRLLRMENFQQKSILEKNFFGSFEDLEILELIKMRQLASIETYAFRNKLSKLRILKLSDVQLSQVPVPSLAYLQNLQTLWITDSLISTLYSQSFKNLQHLSDLDMSHNNIRTIEADAFLGISNYLKHLDLSYNRIQSSSLNALSSKTWPNLQTLTLTYNEDLKNMPEYVFKNMAKLQYINLNQIDLSTISPNLFAGLPEIHTIDLSWNKIRTIQKGAFRNMLKIYELRLNNQFGSYGEDLPLSVFMNIYPDNFDGILDILVKLNFDKTPLKPDQFWKTIKVFSNIEELIISKTRLSKIPAFGFAKNTKLRKIELDSNEITELSQSAFKGLETVLTEVSVSGNKLTTISECVFKDFTKLKHIQIWGNPLHCDCRLKWLHKFIADRHETVPHFQKNQYICTSPAQHAQKNLFSININNLTCVDTYREVCKNNGITPASTKATPSGASTVTPVSKTPVNTNVLSLKVLGTTKQSITVVWNVADKTKITGFKIEYYATINGIKNKTPVLIHRDEFSYSIYKLRSGQFYTICVIPEINHVMSDDHKHCRTAQTLAEGGNSESHTNNINGTEDTDNGRYVIIGSVIASVAFVILVVVGLYLVVKYKLMKLKEIQWAMNPQNPQVRCTATCEDGNAKICTVPNEYMDINDAKISDKYKNYSNKQMQRQFGIETDENMRKKSEYTYSVYRKVPKKKCGPYENETETEIEFKHKDQDEDPYVLRRDLELRHSAPSRLNAKDLMKKDQERNSRPLPATPTEKTVQNTGSDISNDTNKNHVIVTQASVYNTNPKTKERTESVYNEIEASTLPRK